MRRCKHCANCDHRSSAKPVVARWLRRRPLSSSVLLSNGNPHASTTDQRPAADPQLLALLLVEDPPELCDLTASVMILSPCSRVACVRRGSEAPQLGQTWHSPGRAAPSKRTKIGCGRPSPESLRSRTRKARARVPEPFRKSRLAGGLPSGPSVDSQSCASEPSLPLLKVRLMVAARRALRGWRAPRAARCQRPRRPQRPAPRPAPHLRPSTKGGRRRPRRELFNSFGSGSGVALPRSSPSPSPPRLLLGQGSRDP